MTITNKTKKNQNIALENNLDHMWETATLSSVVSHTTQVFQAICLKAISDL